MIVGTSLLDVAPFMFIPPEDDEPGQAWSERFIDHHTLRCGCQPGWRCQFHAKHPSDESEAIVMLAYAGHRAAANAASRPRTGADRGGINRYAPPHRGRPRKTLVELRRAKAKYQREYRRRQRGD